MEQTTPSTTKRDQRLEAQQQRIKDAQKTLYREPGRGRRIALWAGVILGVCALVGGVIYLANNSGNGVVGSALAIPVSASDWQQGPKDAKVTVVEYGDYQCPACGAYHPYFKQLQKDFEGKMLFVFRNFPLSQIHKNAELSARAAEAAGKQGKYWEMHDMLYEHQQDWAEVATAKDVITKYAQDLKLNVSQFNKDLDSSAIGDKISADYAGGVQSQVNSTPTLFVNGKSIVIPQNYDALKKLIQDAVNS